MALRLIVYVISCDNLRHFIVRFAGFYTMKCRKSFCDVFLYGL